MTPFKISIPDSKLKALRDKLSAAALPDEVAGADWDYGVPLDDMKRLSRYWADGYDWRVHEARLNDELPQFTTDVPVEGFGILNVHVIYKKSPVRAAIPLLLLHSRLFPPREDDDHTDRCTRPGSFLKVSKIITPLTQLRDSEPSFDAIAPSLPGYALSEGCTKVRDYPQS